MDIIFTVIVGPIVVGLILLVIEHKTSWFGNRFRKTEDSILFNTPNNYHIPKSEFIDLSQTKVTPISDLESPMADWFQIAKEVKSVLEELYCSEVLEHGDYIPSVEFLEINEVKDSPDKELVFEMVTNFQTGVGYVRVQPSGSIVSCKYEY